MPPARRIVSPGCAAASAFWSWSVVETFTTFPPDPGLVIVTVKVALPVCPALFVAEQVMVVVPTGNPDPDERPAVGADAQVGVSGPSLKSIAVGAEYVSTLTFAPVVESMMSAGTITRGGASVTVTVKLAVAWLPAGSVAVQFTVVVLIANVEPAAGEHEIVNDEALSSGSVALIV